MQRSQLKAAYFESKNSNPLLTAQRIALGQREVATVKLLGSEIGFSFSPGMTLLDLGCADKFLQPACVDQGWSYLGLDYSDLDLETDSFPLRDHSVDIALSLAVLEHLKDPERFLLEVLRCLKPGGLIYLSTPNFQLDWKNFYNDPTHVRPYTPTALEELLRFHGFGDVHTFPGLRCKPRWFYHGPFRFLKAYYLLPFRGDSWTFIPSWMKGHARSIFGLALKPTLISPVITVPSN